MPTLSYIWTRGIYMQCAPEKELITIQASIKKRQRGCRTPLMNADDGNSIHSTTSHQPSQAAHRAADAPPYFSNCPTQSSGRTMELICQRRSTVVRRITDITALGQPHEDRERGGSRDVGAVNVGAWNVSRGAIHNLLPHARTADERGELRCLLVAILEVAPSTRLQYVRMLRSMFEMDRTPLDMVILGLQKIAVRSETKQARPLT
ncbi:phosphatidylinositol 3-related kinase [Trypanosoma cruzi]|nr:phosphatidylinositol 3-related kinase [Trypanosoma cruzi]